MYTLYLKTSPSGLKYLGITNKNPYKYRGSGKYWNRHLKHRCVKSSEIKTDILFQTQDLTELSKNGIYYSNLWNIVESKDFANLIPETGYFSTLGLKHSKETKQLLSKKAKGRTHSETSKKKMSESHKGKPNHQKGRSVSKETRLKLSVAGKNRIFTNQHRIRISNKLFGIKRINLEKPVCKICSQTLKILEEFRSIKLAAQSININECGISSALKGRQKTAGKFMWKLKD